MTANLLSRLQGLTAPDREVDAEIDTTLFGGETVWKQANGTMEMYPASRRASKTHIGGFANEHVPPVTASLDAAVALCERVLPGWAKGFDGGPKTCIAFVDPHDYDDRMFGARYTACAPAPAIALIIAILTALEARENG